MEKFYYPTLPNISGLRLDLYFQIFLVLFLLWLSIWLLIYFIIKYRRRKELEKVLSDIRAQTHNMDKSNFQQKILKSESKEQLALFIEYLNKFHTIQPSTNFDELLSSVGISSKDAYQISICLYKWTYDPKIKNIIEKFFKE
jgi:hypothetical protein